jgi:uncharacterized protein (DUF952 family)
MHIAASWPGVHLIFSGMIFHVTTYDYWTSQKESSTFSAPDLKREGFIHCCTKEQLSGVLERYFKDQTDLVLLHLDENKLVAPLKYEPSTNNENFPHVYGPINKSAIVNVTDVD